jgi:hypothetical protein
MSKPETMVDVWFVEGPNGEKKLAASEISLETAKGMLLRAQLKKIIGETHPDAPFDLLINLRDLEISMSQAYEN